MTESKDYPRIKIFICQELLNSWAAQLPATTPRLAEDIVTIASRLLASGQAESLNPETIRNYLNLTSTSDLLEMSTLYPRKTGNGLKPVLASSRNKL